ncbi:MAG: VOC family protein [Acidobacteriia bacterium]|nr:VOC family protein [Terriglobia bacterium]
MPALKKNRGASPASALTFNHAMVYSRDVPAAVRFYAGVLGFKVLEEYQGHNTVVYARLKSPRGNTTIAVHMVAPGQELHTGGVRLYFETKDLDRFCKRLEAAGVKFSEAPKVMPWGWKHAYLDDPDGHEVSLYWAGAKRIQKTGPMKAR